MRSSPCQVKVSPSSLVFIVLTSFVAKKLKYFFLPKDPRDEKRLLILGLGTGYIVFEFNVVVLYPKPQPWFNKTDTVFLLQRMAKATKIPTRLFKLFQRRWDLAKLEVCNAKEEQKFSSFVELPMDWRIQDYFPDRTCQGESLGRA